MQYEYESAQGDNASSFDVRELLQAMYDGWLIILICVTVSVLHSVDYLRTATYIYSAQMKVTPPQNGSDASPAQSTLGNLASLAGVSVPGGQSSGEFNLFIESLSSRDLIEDLAKDREIMMTFFGGEWDGTAQSWREPPHDPWYEWRSAFRSAFALRPIVWQPPDSSRLQGVVSSSLQVQQDARKPYPVRIVFNHPDPEFAVRFLNKLTMAADNLMRQRALLRTKDNIDYLSNKLATVTNADHRMAITQALSEQEKSEMGASSGAPFAADIFERPWAPTLPSSPVPRSILLTGVLIGAGVGGVISFALRRYSARLRIWLLSKLSLRKS